MRDYELIRSSRKTLALEIKGDRVIVRTPMRTPRKTVERFVAEHEGWIDRKLSANAEKAKALAVVEPLSEEELKALIKQAKQYIPQRASYYSELMGITYGRISIRSQRTKWGSCSAKKNLNFNCLLMLTPPDIIDSVVVHELCHLVEMNHSRRFYALLYKYCPDYDRCRKWLNENGACLMAKLEKNEQKQTQKT